MARNFAGSGASDKVESASVTSTLLVSYSMWLNWNGSSADEPEAWYWGADGGTPFVSLGYTDGTNFYLEFGASGEWSAPIFTANKWHHLCITINGSASTNTPIFYYDGVSQTVSVSTANSTAEVASTNLLIANYRGGDAGFAWAGGIFDFAGWSVILNQNEVTELARGVRPNRMRPGSLIYWFPLNGLASPEPDWTGKNPSGTIVNTSYITGPPVDLI